MALFGQCDGDRFREFTFTDFTVTSNLEYGENVTHQGTAEVLTLDVYQPANDAETSRPLVIFAHGGFFLSGSKNGGDIVPLCQDLAQMGYVTASINYRLGFPFSNLEASMTEAAMRGVQDMKAAIRWFRKSVAEDGNPYGIDPDHIYIGGVSAGAYITLHLAYLDQESELPTYVNLANPGLAGGIEGESGNPGYSSEVNAIIGIAGALGEVDWVQEGDEPAMLFHGDEDSTVPYGTAIQLILGVVAVTEVDGSSIIAQRMDELGIEHCFETHEGFDHVPHANNAMVYDTTLSMISNFLSHYICDVELDCEYRELAASLDEVTHGESFLLYPNPASDAVSVSYDQPGMALISVFDMTGKKILARSIRSAERVALDELANGCYIVELVAGERRESKRLVLNR